MPWPEATVPKFGDWDSNSDLSYSVVFDKARADKEGFLPSFKDESVNVPSYKGPKKAPGLTKERGSVDGGSERGSTHRSERGSPRLSSIPPPMGRQVPLVASKEETFAKDPGSYTRDTHAHPPSYEASYGRGHRPAKPMYHGYPIARKTTRSQGSSECASMTETPDNVMVPRFGDWESAQSREGFTVIFDRVRNEKKATTPRIKTPPRLILNDEDLYGASSRHRNRRGWLSLCCLASQ